MQFYRIWPFMAGFPAEETVGDLDSLGPKLSFLKFVLDIEPPSDVIGQDNIILATEKLVDALKPLNPSGVKFHKDNVEVTGDANFADGTFKANFDEWWWLELFGTPGKDDFAYDSGLIVHERILSVLEVFKLSYCDIFEYP
jgi:hypothetical protein